ncbi:YraN family protein [Nocardioides sp.]|uniref:YraN family protein n=1 Tax=Nocardioides sp. TaxID=35761 RepID=UPI00286D78C9|nr:YraN family protein [Nocardioides sp.]
MHKTTDTTAQSPPRLNHNQALGAYGERLAARFLTRQGMVLLDHNWRCPQGEIDLVLRERRTLVICEVKTRTSHDFGTPHEAIDRRKVERLCRLAACWLRVHAARPDDIRLDLVAVLRTRSGEPQIEHVRGLT